MKKYTNENYTWLYNDKIILQLLHVSDFLYTDLNQYITYQKKKNTHK